MKDGRGLAKGSREEKDLQGHGREKGCGKAKKEGS